MTALTLFPALPALAWALAALLAKTTLTSVLQMVSRARSGVFPIPEDARLMRGTIAADESPFVRRCANVWRNDTENLPFFLAVALVHVLLGAPADTERKRPSSVDLMFGATQLMMQSIVANKLRQCRPDILVRPPVSRFRVLDFMKVDAVMAETASIKDELKRAVEAALDARRK